MPEIEIRKVKINPIECVKEGFELIKPDYWMMFVILLVGALIAGVSFFIAGGAMSCGIYYAYLKRIDGDKPTIDDLWKGMQWFLPGLVVMAAIVIPIFIVYGVLYVPIILSAVMGSHLSQDELIGMLAGAFVIDLVLIVIMVCLHTLLIFSFALIVDKGLGGFRSMIVSARAVFRNLGGVAGLFAVNFGLALLGELALCIGIYFVTPIILAANVVAYRKIFPRQGAAAPVFSGGAA